MSDNESDSTHPPPPPQAKSVEVEEAVSPGKEHKKESTGSEKKSLIEWWSDLTTGQRIAGAFAVIVSLVVPVVAIVVPVTLSFWDKNTLSLVGERCKVHNECESKYCVIDERRCGCQDNGDCEFGEPTVNFCYDNATCVESPSSSPSLSPVTAPPSSSTSSQPTVPIIELLYQVDIEILSNERFSNGLRHRDLGRFAEVAVQQFFEANFPDKEQCVLMDADYCGGAHLSCHDSTFVKCNVKEQNHKGDEKETVELKFSMEYYIYNVTSEKNEQYGKQFVSMFYQNDALAPEQSGFLLTTFQSDDLRVEIGNLDRIYEKYSGSSNACIWPGKDSIAEANKGAGLREPEVRGIGMGGILGIFLAILLVVILGAAGYIRNSNSKKEIDTDLVEPAAQLPPKTADELAQGEDAGENDGSV